MNTTNVPRRVCLEESEATAIVERRILGLKIKLGLARVKAKRAVTLDEKIAAKRLEKDLQEKLRAAYRSYFDDIDALLEKND